MNAQSIFGSTVHRCLVDLTFRRFYRSERVFGYRAKDKRDYEVSQEILDARNRQSNLYRLAYAYRQHGHLKAHVDPVALSKPPIMLPNLDPRQYGLDDSDNVDFNGIIAADRSSGTVREAIELLERSYSKDMSAEFLYLESNEEIEWFAARMETLAQETLDANTRITIARELLKSQTFDTFLASKFVTVKRYGGEGAESMMAFFHELLRIATADQLEQIVLCMPHRGRLNLLTQALNMRPAKLFRKLKGLPEFPEEYKFSGDVTSHLISSTDLTVDDKQIHLTLLYNPSHLEAVNPVSMGKTRAKQMSCADGDYGSDKCRWSDKILNVQLHGDAAYSAQGINQESLALCGVPHFEIGGSIHLIVNNQLGFTTPASRGRSSRYCSDIAKSINAPVIHVNGIRPEEVLKAARLAIEYQRKFRKDVFVDMNCYRRWGHNELDDPTFTNPALYKIIEARKTIPDEYVDRLKEEGVLSDEDVNETVQNHIKWLSSELESAEKYQPSVPCFERQWSGFEQAPDAVTTWDTGIDSEILTHIGTRSVTYPKDFCIHPRLLSNYVKPRLTRIAEGVNVDWATAEALAIGSLLYQGHNVRISGQDVGRGTFSHRHVMLVDQNTDLVHIPLNNLKYDGQGYLEVANSILSEEAVLAFEYGMSIESPDNLIIWEAQFGDFFNGAQTIIDTFISSGEAKWLTSSGLVMLLPHGYDGAGPEHSSSRMERFLQMTDSSEDTPDGESINMQVVNPTTAAQYFHLLRRQMVRNWRKPLVVISPKTLLRLPDANSDFKEMAPGTYFHPVIGDSSVHASVVNRVLFVSGKHYYALDAERKSQKSTNVAIVRLESLCPFPTLHLQDVIRKYSKAKDFVWCQEEHQNMGAWSYVQPRFEKLIGRKLKYIGRKPSAAPAVGIGSRHQAEVKEIITRPFLDKL